ncbi:hypothetical protein, partial [Aeromonas australiensis]|uniref:hypothetical protein n=1 Tax=Aeromonas australiensis TaxID=1114880 RepID=UPI001F19C83D
PESGKIDRMHDDSRAQELVCLATPNLPEFLTVNVLSPQNAKNQKIGRKDIKVLSRRLCDVMSIYCF